MFSIVMAALRSRRSSLVAPWRSRPAQPVSLMPLAAAAAIAALAAGFAAVAPAAVAVFGRSHATIGLVAAASVTTAIVVVFASLAICLVSRIGRSATDSAGFPSKQPRPGFPRGYGGGVAGAVAGLAVGSGVVSTGSSDLVPITLGIGVASAAVAVAACRAGAYLGYRRAAGLRTATNFLGATDLGRPSDSRWAIGPDGVARRRLARGWLVAAGALVTLAVAARQTGPVGADLVPYVVASAIACCAGGLVRPVARWIGCRAVRVTEFARDERPRVTVDGDTATAGEAVPHGNHPTDEAVAGSLVDGRDTGRFVRGTIAATGYLARRPDLERVVALAVAGVIIAGAATFAWTSSVIARQDRATIELGADRVVTVAPVPPEDLMADVRAADPTGRYAMAADVVPAAAASGAVVAVDGARLGAVVTGIRSGPSGRQLAALLRPTRVPPTRVTGATLQLNVIASSTVGTAAKVAVLLAAPNDITYRVEFGPLRAGEHVYAAAAPCANGCTVNGFSVAGAVVAAQPVVSVILRELRQRTPDRTVLDASAFADASRWRIGPGGTPDAATFAVSEAGLDIAVAGETASSDNPGVTGGSSDPVAYLDAGMPTLAVTGPETPTGQSFDLPPAQADAITVDRLGAPVPGVPPGGILVDLAAVVPPDTGVTSQVWLADDAPRSVIGALSHHGLRVVSRTSIGDRAAAYAEAQPVAFVRFQLLAGVVMLSCVALMVGAVTQAHRGTRTVARGIGLAVAVWSAGVGGALVARHAGPDFATGFGDGWARVPPPPLVGAVPFGAFAVASGLVLAVAVLAVGAARRPRPGVVSPPGPARPPDGRVGAAIPDRRDLAVGGAHGTVSAT